MHIYGYGCEESYIDVGVCDHLSMASGVCMGCVADVLVSSVCRLLTLT